MSWLSTTWPLGSATETVMKELMYVCASFRPILSIVIEIVVMPDFTFAARGEEDDEEADERKSEERRQAAAY